MKQDRKEIASKQRHEIDYIVKRWGIPRATVKDVVWAVGKSRIIAYAIFRLMGYVIPGNPPKRLEKKIKEIAVKMGL